MVTMWEAEIIDESIIPREYLITKPNIAKINYVVRALKDKTNISGIKAVPKVFMRETGRQRYEEI